MTGREVPASIGQRLLWFLEHYRADTTSLNCPVVCRLHGPLDVGELQVALDRLVARHEALRTTLHRRGRHLVQHVHPAGPVDLVRRTLTAPTPEGMEGVLEQAVADEVRSTVDVSEWPVRITLWELGPAEHVLAVNMHHLVSDAWSCGIIVQDLIRFLDAGPDVEPELTPVGWQYPDYAQWQHDQRESGALKPHQDYWSGKLTGMTLPEVPRLDVDPAATDRRSFVEAGTIERGTFNRLRLIARTERTTLFAVMLSLYYLMLGRETDRTDLTVASLFANRSRREVQSTVGFFANMLMLRTTLDRDATFSEVVRATRQTVIDAFLHEGIPYQMLPISKPGGRADDVVFQMLLTPPPGTKVEARGVQFDLYVPEALRSRFGLELGLIPQPAGDCRALLFYDDQFAPEWAKSFLAGYLELAERAAADPGTVLPARAGSAATAR
ncbi:condensation domain-containing protein [Actinokineospora enzanensis]|uniref:condensation domain-containing protein n=1 Tax=Actinokineospora enzanensis TaxID=155975 RepID=UPI0003A0281E|nr:condensation domain-containing protein [Actinokineospora enzanensis]